VECAGKSAPATVLRDELSRKPEKDHHAGGGDDPLPLLARARRIVGLGLEQRHGASSLLVDEMCATRGAAFSQRLALRFRTSVSNDCLVNPPSLAITWNQQLRQKFPAKS